jgi:hypothetical protein
MNIIEIKGVTKDYALGNTTVHALRGIDLTIEEGDLMTIMDRRVRARPPCSTSSAASTRQRAAA